MTFKTRAATYRSTDGDSYAEALAEWRAAARVASNLWNEYTRTAPDFRPLVFGAYQEALDAEEIAANVLRAMAIPKAA
jgi:hypothetical protein